MAFREAPNCPLVYDGGKLLPYEQREKWWKDKLALYGQNCIEYPVENDDRRIDTLISQGYEIMNEKAKSPYRGHIMLIRFDKEKNELAKIEKQRIMEAFDGRMKKDIGDIRIDATLTRKKVK